jgi:hypothetical protein
LFSRIPPNALIGCSSTTSSSSWPGALFQNISYWDRSALFWIPGNPVSLLSISINWLEDTENSKFFQALKSRKKELSICPNFVGIRKVSNRLNSSFMCCCQRILINIRGRSKQICESRLWLLLRRIQGVSYWMEVFFKWTWPAAYTQFIYSNRDVYITISLCSKLLHSATAIRVDELAISLHLLSNCFGFCASSSHLISDDGTICASTK